MTSDFSQAGEQAKDLQTTAELFPLGAVPEAGSGPGGATGPPLRLSSGAENNGARRGPQPSPSRAPPAPRPQPRGRHNRPPTSRRSW